MSLTQQRYNGLVGQRIGFGQCGSLASDFFQYQTGYNFADDVSNPAPRLASAPTSGYFATAWDVYNQVDWKALGYERIDKPAFGDVRGDDIFFIRPRDGLPTGHTGLVASTAGNNITTFEQNVLNALYVQKLSDGNSWSWYGGFDGIVRKKADSNNNSNNNNKGEEEMNILVETADTKRVYQVMNGFYTHVINPSILANMKKAMSLNTMPMTQKELETMYKPLK